MLNYEFIIILIFCWCRVYACVRINAQYAKRSSNISRLCHRISHAELCVLCEFCIYEYVFVFIIIVKSYRAKKPSAHVWLVVLFLFVCYNMILLLYSSSLRFVLFSYYLFFSCLNLTVGQNTAIFESNFIIHCF